MFFLLNKAKQKVKPSNTLLTLSTCWYALTKAKFGENTYKRWMQNLFALAQTNRFNLVVYTDADSYPFLFPFIHTKNIKVVLKPMETFVTFAYQAEWMRNHCDSHLELHDHIDWRLNMLWNEKVFFVQETIKCKYFDTLYYGWCDIGYFRNRPDDLHTKYLQTHQWPNAQTLLSPPFNDNCIHYGCVQNNPLTYLQLSNTVKNHYVHKKALDIDTINRNICFAGGFFLLKRDLIDTFAQIYRQKIEYYFANQYTIKDDQTLLVDILFNHPTLFYTHTEQELNQRVDPWFMFQRLLL